MEKISFSFLGDINFFLLLRARNERKIHITIAKPLFQTGSGSKAS